MSSVFLFPPLALGAYYSILWFSLNALVQKYNANFLFALSPFFAFSLYNTIQNLMEPILLSVLQRKIDIHYWRHITACECCALWVRCDVRRGPWWGGLWHSTMFCGQSRQCQTQIVDRVDGYNLLSNRCIPTTCLQSNGQIPSSRFARAFFVLPRCEISPKKHTDHHNIISFKKVLQIWVIFIFTCFAKKKKKIDEGK